jgi:hypothetical protein
VSVIIISVALLIALYYFIRILINFHKISTILKNYAENTETELKDIGHHVRQSPLFTFFFGKEKKKREPERSSKKTI